MMRLLAQTPLGLRKSGMPDSVEIPAPVKPTMRPDVAIISAASLKVIVRRLLRLRRPLKVEPGFLNAEHSRIYPIVIDLRFPARLHAIELEYARRQLDAAVAQNLQLFFQYDFHKLM